MDPSEVFAQFFGANFGFDLGPDMGRRWRGKGADDVIPFDVTLEDLYNGKTVKMNMEKEEVCGSCSGWVRSSFITLGTEFLPHQQFRSTRFS